FGNTHNRMFFRKTQPQIVQRAPSPGIDLNCAGSSRGYCDQWPEIEVVANTASLVVRSGMTHGVRINKSSVEISQNLAEALKHALPGHNLDTRISDEQYIRCGVCNQVLQRRRRMVTGEYDIHEISVGRTTITPAIRLLFKKPSNFSSTTAPRL